MTQSKNNLSDLYDINFYENMCDGSRVSAQIVCARIANLFPHIQSVVDFGCGPGIWLKEFLLMGKEVRGFDVGSGSLAFHIIPEELLTRANLCIPQPLEKKFDLAICLEVIEHLPEEYSSGLLESLTQASDLILFSAALPGQGGTGHLNEQWPGYWIKRFSRLNFKCLDILRPLFWRDSRIEWWYRQNMMLYIHKSALKRFETLETLCNFGGYPLIIPEMLSVVKKTKIKYVYMDLNKGLKKLLLHKIKEKLKRILNLFKRIYNNYKFWR